MTIIESDYIEIIEPYNSVPGYHMEEGSLVLQGGVF